MNADLRRFERQNVHIFVYPPNLRTNLGATGFRVVAFLEGDVASVSTT